MRGNSDPRIALLVQARRRRDAATAALQEHATGIKQLFADHRAALTHNLQIVEVMGGLSLAESAEMMRAEEVFTSQLRERMATDEELQAACCVAHADLRAIQKGLSDDVPHRKDR